MASCIILFILQCIGHILAFNKAYKKTVEQLETYYDEEEDKKNANRYVTAINRSKGIIKRYEEQKTVPTHLMELHTDRIGDIAFATNPFELFIDYQHRIQARSPFTQTFIIQLCAIPDGNYRAGYLATERGIANKGYSAAIFDNQVAPSGGQQLVEATLAQLKAIAEK